MGEGANGLGKEQFVFKSRSGRKTESTNTLTKDIVYYTYSKHNYIYVLVHKEIQLHVSVLHVDHLQVELLTYRLVIVMCGANYWSLNLFLNDSVLC